MSGLEAERAAFEADWERLWEAARAFAGPGEALGAFEAVGLWLEPVGSGGWEYDATPADAVTFAGTGRDGVHFSWVPVGDVSVIAMTVPMMWDRPNVVLGRDLKEFLALGCRYGYFSLEQLAYHPGPATTEISQAVDDDDSGSLAFLRREFSLHPSPGLGARLAELAPLTPAPAR